MSINVRNVCVCVCICVCVCVCVRARAHVCVCTYMTKYHIIDIYICT